jgi:hypothetical protein
MRFNPLKPIKPVPPPRPEPLAKGAIPAPSPVSHEPVLSENNTKDGFELRFPTRPSQEVLAAFHATQQLPPEHRWHWHRKLKFWYARRNDVTRAFAQSILSGSIVVPPIAAEMKPPLQNDSPSPEGEGRDEGEQCNVIAVNFVQPSPAVSIPLGQGSAVPAWKARLLRRQTVSAPQFSTTPSPHEV